MNKVERVRAAIAGEKVDRVPASFWFHFTPDKHHGKASVQAHMDFYRESNVDFLKVMNEHPCYYLLHRLVFLQVYHFVSLLQSLLGHV